MATTTRVTDVGAAVISGADEDTKEYPREPFKSHSATYSVPGGQMVVTTEWWAPDEPESLGGVPDFDVFDGEDNGLIVTQRINYLGMLCRPSSVTTSWVV